jgi:predicted nucleic acid-binding protein
MILPDTSVWIDHLRRGEHLLAELLCRDDLLLHAYVIGELALGHLPKPMDTIARLQIQLQAPVRAPGEILAFIAEHGLAGAGLGYVDVHLLASVSVTRHAKLWTLDKRLYAAASRLGLAFTP